MLETEGDRKVQQRIEQARREGARTLNLSDMKLRKLPKSIASLTQLQGLNREFQRSRVLGVHSLLRFSDFRLS